MEVSSTKIKDGSENQYPLKYWNFSLKMENF